MNFRDAVRSRRFASSYSPGMQEWIEAVAFRHFLARGGVITKGEVETLLAEDLGVPFDVPFSDYLLGLFDMTGEALRYAVSSVSKGERHNVFDACIFLQQLQEGFVALPLPPRDFAAKLETLIASVLKLEKACYQVRLRGAEYPDALLGRISSNDGETPE